MYAVFSKVIIFFFNDTATTEIYTLSLHDALPISGARTSDLSGHLGTSEFTDEVISRTKAKLEVWARSEEHTSELQSRLHLVCRLLLEKKKKERTLVIRYWAKYRRTDTRQSDTVLV